MRLDMKPIRVLVVLLCLFSLSNGWAVAQQWLTVGPEGGTVRSLTLDPKNPDRIFLGTSAGRLYLSTDNGVNWSRYAQLGTTAEMVLDHVVIDPNNSRIMYVAAWNAQSPNEGELFRSKDGGRNWEIVPELHGKSIRALALAPSDSRILVAGALDGIYRSRDGGDAWERISPEHHAEIKNVESIAIDPVDPGIIYAGTWHLPWKTEDGGKSWHSIKKGVIDDSDVFSIVIDPANSSSIFMGACSGMYRSESAGELFRKIPGLPYSARRTRKLQIDPANHNVVYAGTTEGLWKTTDAGATWDRITGPNIVVNDVVVDPRHPARVLLATDRSGVLASDDAGVSFALSNRGFAHRQAAALLVDRNDKAVLYAGLLNDKEFGGVFISRDAGQTWMQVSKGLDGRDVFVLRQTNNDSIIAGTDRGVFELKPNSSRWLQSNSVTEEQPAAEEQRQSGGVQTISALPRKPVTVAGPSMNARVSALEVTPQKWYAITSSGLFVSAGSGHAWRKEVLPGVSNPTSISVADRVVVAASRTAVAVSVNGGGSWVASKPMDTSVTINSVLADPSGSIWVAAREGLFRSTDAGESWKRVSLLYQANILTIQFDQESHRILATGGASTNIFETTDNGHTWTPIHSNWQVRNLIFSHGRLLGTTTFDGVVVQQEGAADAQVVSATGTR